MGVLNLQAIYGRESVTIRCTAS